MAPKTCESFQGQAYTSATYGFTIACPSDFSWETFGSPYPDQSWQFLSRIVGTQYLGNYPPGQIELGVYSKDADNLRVWVSRHVGPPMSSATGVHWDSVTNVTDTTVAAIPAISFDYTHQGPEAPDGFQAVAFLVGTSSVVVLDWWAYKTAYSSEIAAAAQLVLAGIKLVAPTFQILQVGDLGRVAYSAVLGANEHVWFTSNAHSVFEWSAIGAGGEHPLAAGGSDPLSLTEGQDGTVWFTAGGSLGGQPVSGGGQFFPAPDGQPSAGIVAGPDGALWYTEEGRDRIARMTIAGAVTEFSLPRAPQPAQCGGWCPTAIVSGPDGALWFAESQLGGGGGIGRITTAGAVTHWRVPNAAPNSIVAGPDGSLWFGEDRAPQLGRITTGGDVTEIAISGDGFGTRAVAAGQGLLWFSVIRGPIDGSGPGRIGVLSTGSTNPIYYDLPAAGVITQILPLSDGGATLIDFSGKVFQARPGG